jgi:GNAT superfamily N-acetyltransferase
VSAETEAPLIRFAEMQDIEGMAEVLGEFFDSHAAALPAIFTSASAADRISYLREMLAAAEQRWLVATLRDRIVGMLYFEAVRRAARIGRHAENHVMVHVVAVRKSERRRGIATRLLGRAQIWAKEHGFDAIRVHVWDFNEAAQRLYESVGYSTSSRIMSRSSR